MAIYSKFELSDFIICLGCKGYRIKEYFANYRLHMSDAAIDLSTSLTTVHHHRAEPWRVTLVDTGNKTMTVRIRGVCEHIGDQNFCLTYGDGVVAIDLSALLGARLSGDNYRYAAPGRFGALEIDTADRSGELSREARATARGSMAAFCLCGKRSIQHRHRQRDNNAHGHRVPRFTLRKEWPIAPDTWPVDLMFEAVFSA
jgi:hypothetical protein